MGTATRRMRSVLMVVSACIVATVLAVVSVWIVVGVFESAGLMLVRSSPLPDRVEHDGRSYVYGPGQGCASAPPPGTASPAFEITVLFGADVVVFANDAGPDVPTVLYADDGSGCYPRYSLEGGP